MIVDSHHHVWTRAQYADVYHSYGSPTALRTLLRDYPPSDLAPFLNATGVDRSILVQLHMNQQHNYELLTIASKWDWIGGVIGWLDLLNTEFDSHLSALIKHPLFKGIREPLELKSSPELVLQPQVLSNLQQLTDHKLVFELLIDAAHWSVLPKLAAAMPDLTLVINHFGKPDQTSVDAWLAMLDVCAKYDNVLCKLSGLMVLLQDWQHWRPEEVKPYIDHLLERFGAERLMIATDWPVSTVIGSYERVFGAVVVCLDDVDEHAQAKILGENAQRIYQIV